MNNFDNKEHWEKVYATKAENEVSWYQPNPHTSLQFFEAANLPLDANIIDVGGGDSHFVDTLLNKGFTNITVLDISANAIKRAQARLKERASKVNWIVSDVVQFETSIKYDFWHDRAAFHFLKESVQVAQYLGLANKYIKPGGYLVIGTFSETGPPKCSGLEIQQYNETSLLACFSPTFTRLQCMTQDHTTPMNTIQNFLFCSFKKNG